ncbi:MAG: TetR/AcrR family transcriptional regulator [Actinomycetota bacterium]|nr:TetR/AcrR family transcriptional regulator [Actinomycetota bacterium]
MAGRAQTRAALIEAAGAAFAERGLRDVSIDELARRAGFTKGAFYANFASKEELFLAMLDERFERRAREMHRALDSDEAPEVQARRSADEFAADVAADPEWERLFFEFAAHASRNPEFRVQLVARYRRLREGMAADYERRAAELGMALPFPADHLALMTFAMGNGIALEQLLEPEAVPEGFFGTMLTIWVAGLRALSEG